MVVLYESINLLCCPNLNDAVLYKSPNTITSPVYFQGEWRHIELLFKTRRKTIHGKTLEVKHLDVPMRLTYHWDPTLERLPSMLHDWTSQPHLAPTLLITGKF